MLSLRYTVGFQEAFKKFLASPERNNEHFFNQKEFEVIDTPPAPIAKRHSTPRKNEICFKTPVSKNKGSHKKKLGRPRKSKSPPDKINSTRASQEQKLNYGVANKTEIGNDDIYSKVKGGEVENLTKRRSSRFEKAHDANEEINVKSEDKNITDSNEYATKCPHCHFLKLNLGFADHVKECQQISSTDSIVPFESLLSSIYSLQNITEDTLQVTRDVGSGEQKIDTTSEDGENRSLIEFTSQNSGKKSKRDVKKSKDSTVKKVDLRPFYFGRPKRKARDMALQSVKDILDSESKGKEEDYKYYKKVSNKPVDYVSTCTTSMKEDNINIPSSEDLNSSDDTIALDEVEQLANELIKNWDTKDMMKEAFDIESMSDELKSAKKQVNKSKQKNISMLEKKRPCKFSNNSSCNDSFGIIGNEGDGISAQQTPKGTSKLRNQHLFNCNGCQYSTPHKNHFEKHIQSKNECKLYNKAGGKKYINASGDILNAQEDSRYVSDSFNEKPAGFNSVKEYANQIKDMMEDNSSIAAMNDVSLHSCKDCSFTTYSEVALSTHSIIYH